MNAITGKSATQSKDQLTPQQRQLLNYFDDMKDVAQLMMVDFAAEMVRRLPRQRPQLRVVAGGAA